MNEKQWLVTIMLFGDATVQKCKWYQRRQIKCNWSIFIVMRAKDFWIRQVVSSDNRSIILILRLLLVSRRVGSRLKWYLLRSTWGPARDVAIVISYDPDILVNARKVTLFNDSVVQDSNSGLKDESLEVPFLHDLRFRRVKNSKHCYCENSCQQLFHHWLIIESKCYRTKYVKCVRVCISVWELNFSRQGERET